ncbi:MAG: hypothetical protein WC402_02025 [Candidatus Pacearchaeota archaeon]|jgi:hypothetical protein
MVINLEQDRVYQKLCDAKTTLTGFYATDESLLLSRNYEAIQTVLEDFKVKMQTRTMTRQEYRQIHSMSIDSIFSQFRSAALEFV